MGTNTVGTLTVDLVANTASFESNLNKAGSTTRAATDDIKNSFDKMGKGVNFSMSEARGSMQLFEEAVGVRLPRHLNSLIAQIPGVGALFANMLPIAGVLVAIAVVAKLIEHHEALIAAQRKMSEEVANLTIKERDRTEGLELENLKIEDQIAKLEGRPSKNRLAEVLIEAKIKADNLAQSMDEVQKKSEESVDSALGFWGRLKREFGSTHDAAQTVLRTLDAITHGNASDSSKYVTDVTKINDELRNMADAYKKVQEARSSLSEAKGQAGEADAIKALGEAYKGYEQAATNAGVVVRSLDHDNFALRQHIEEAAISAHSGAESMVQDAKNLASSVELANKEEIKDAQDRANRVTEARINADKLIKDSHLSRIAQEQAFDNAAAMAAIDLSIERSKNELTLDQNLFNEKRDLIQKEVDERIKASEAEFSNDSEALKKKLALVKTEMGDHQAEIISLQAQIKALTEKHEGELSRIHKTGVQEIAAVDKQQTADLAEEVQKRAEIARAAAQEQLRFDLEVAKLDLAAANQEASFKLATSKNTASAVLQAELDAENRSYDAQQKANEKELASLDKKDKQYDALVTAANHKMEIETQAHENKITTIKEHAAEERYKKISAAENRLAEALSRNVAKSLVESKNLADGLASMGKQILEDALANALKMILIGDMQQAKDAGHAAASAFKWVMTDVPFPANAIMAPVAAAAAFAGVMAFEKGGIVEGDLGKAIPVVAHGKEMILPADLSEGLQHMIRNKDTHVVNPYVDGKSMNAAPQHTYHIDARGADAGVVDKIHKAMRSLEDRTVARSVAASQDRARRRS